MVAPVSCGYLISLRLGYACYITTDRAIACRFSTWLMTVYPISHSASISAFDVEVFMVVIEAKKALCLPKCRLSNNLHNFLENLEAARLHFKH
ncbi:hypothetical protein HI914_05350 [Erysiphe necator]|nr:hypothetical protein HI914_05350 [Erysiphe necator]